MTMSENIRAEIVSDSARLVSAARDMAASDAIALDTESNSFHRYPEQLCLIQVATRQSAYLIDSIVLGRIDPLGEILSTDSIMKVIHGADYDVRSLDRHQGFRIRNLFDTSIAARFIGITRFGLADVTKELLGKTIEKSKRLQLIDWGKRPLIPEALEYAAADVRYLLELQSVLSQRLLTLGRTAWVREECARLEEVRYTEPNPETAFLSVKGARELDERGLALLRSLFRFRENEARQQHRPPFFIIPDAALVYLAANPASSLQDIPGIGRTGVQHYAQGITQAMREGMAAPPVPRPLIKYDFPGPEAIDRLRRLKAWRTSLGVALSLDPSLLWPTG